MSKVSIIIPNFNSAKFINETLESIGNQTYSNWECIIVDDGSVDTSKDIIETFKLKDERFKFFSRPKKLKKGANSCRNFGYEKSSGAYVNWFDADDVMLPNFIESKVNEFIKNDNLNFVISSGYFADENLSKESLKLKNFYQTENLYQEYAFWRFKLITNSVMFSSEFLNDNNYRFNENLYKAQEYELFSKIFYKASNSQYSIIESPTYFYRSNPNSSTVKNRVYNKKFKTSEIYVVKQDFLRSIMDKDIELLQSRHRLLINLLKKSVESGDNANVNSIVNFYKEILTGNFFLKYSIIFFTRFFTILPVGFIRWDYLLKHQTLKVIKK
ncbi:glycosyltransferase family 2 protein [Psychroflexus sp. CAK57W]|uniref:glycosyltransferase family 2 protein n=1 Tax=Psychroflexus curvus TaxID=2873595 RepID=UPI001CCA1B2A|nr:glycosyltransferase family A protein [Psychroflexus curvus]MBZ9628909.1 glycosyltransferase family 2 protein [Psychroflexus curvus]MBZ9787840.1 glycosyltransferase family 2 protein [Psychroflexus curvus]